MTLEPSAVDIHHEFVAFDLETTGLSAERERIVEIGAVRFDREGRELGRFQTLVNPGKPIPYEAWAVHRISDADVRHAPSCSEVLPRFLDFLGAAESTTILAHNAVFDASFLGHELGRIGALSPPHAVADTLHLARSRLPKLGNHRLDTLARHFQLDPGDAHRALADSLRVKGIWLAMGGVGLIQAGMVAYSIFDHKRPAFAPLGWEKMLVAIERAARVKIAYKGGSHGTEPREITPLQIENKGGTDYLVALCHVDAKKKKFRLDRLVCLEVIG